MESRNGLEGETLMKVSLIISTRNRAEQLRACLTHVAALSFPGAFEIVLVDNGSSDATSQVIGEFAASSRAPVVPVFEAAPGLARARNAGAARAGGDVLAFTDDDCYPAPDFLSVCARAFLDPRIGYLAGRILLHDPADAPVTIMESMTPQRFAPKTFVRAGAVQGAAMAIRARAMRQIGGFDELFGAGAPFPAEDIEAVSRLSLAGWAGLYDPDLVVRHHHGRRAADVPALMAAYDVGRGAYHMKLLLAQGRLDWFGLALAEAARRGLKDPRALKNEALGALRYWRALRRVRGAAA